MLKTKKNIEFTGESIFDGVSAAGYSAKIDSNNPSDITLANWINDKDAYKTNRSQCYAEKQAFEDAAYELQEEMISETESQL